MEHIVNRTSLGQWDLDAANTVYGAGAVCNAPTSVSVSANPTSVTSGGSSTLTATVSGGTGPFNYQWYVGNVGDKSSPITGSGTNSATINASGIASTSSFWVVVTPTCGGTGTNSSNAATVTVAACNPPSGVSASASSNSVSAGNSVVLTASVAGGTTPFTYTWTANGAFAGSGVQLIHTPSSNTNYQVTVSNACSNGVASNVVTVTVVGTPCNPPTGVSASASSTTINAGQSVTLTASAAGGTTPFTISWFANGALAGTGGTITVTPSTTTTYTAQVSNCSGQAVSASPITITVNQAPACNTTLSGITVTPQNPLPAQSFTLTANATTTSGTLSYQWYRGGQGDTSNPIGNSQTITLTQTAASQTYWVVVASTCGGVQPAAQTTVNLNTGTCGTNPNQLCIAGARYRVTLTATDPRTGKTGQGVANYQSDVFGYFTLPDFSNPQDPQVFVKVLGPVAPPIGQNAPWVFYAGLTDLRYTLTVVDTQTGQTFNSYNVLPPAQDPRGLQAQQSIGDYDVNGSNAHQGDKNVQCPPVQITPAQTFATPGNCPTNASTLCLLNRFTVTLRAKVNNPTGATDNGATIPANSQFGFFTTPNIAGPTDVQAFIKMLDATSINQGYWVFLGGLTDFELTYTVTDTQNGKQKIYRKPAGSTCGWSDVPNAF